MYTEATEKKQFDNYIENTIRRNLNAALFDLNSRLGRNTNLIGITAIVITVLLSMVATLDGITVSTRNIIAGVEILITLVFAIEYFLRVYAAKKPLAYIFSFYGLIDLLTWLPLLLLGDATLAIRLLRVLRLLKLIRYLKALHLFLASLRDALEIMLVVAFTILIIIAISGNLIFLLEPETFGNAFTGSWWSLVTMTTVGYGDIVPATTGGKILASILMVTGITIFAMLTGTISVKVSQIVNRSHRCSNCNNWIAASHRYCPDCATEQNFDVKRCCASCNTNLNAGDKYCANCGIKILQS